MADDKNQYGRKDPPEPHEWQSIWKTLERSDTVNKVFGPIAAVLLNWKAVGAILLVLTLANQPQIAAILLSVKEALQ